MTVPVTYCNGSYLACIVKFCHLTSTLQNSIIPKGVREPHPIAHTLSLYSIPQRTVGTELFKNVFTLLLLKYNLYSEKVYRDHKCIV